MAVESEHLSIVEYYAESSGYRCGYCKSPNTNISQGMWAHSLTVQDYQDLVDRGWRRSGCYCYKPTLHLTCCPMYTIKCSVLDFKLSKSQKKKLKRFHNFLAYGKKKSTAVKDIASESPSDLDSGDDMISGFSVNDIPDLKEKAERAQLSFQSSVVKTVDSAFDGESSTCTVNEKCETKEESRSCEAKQEAGSSVKETSNTDNLKRCQEKLINSPLNKSTRPGDGIDPSRPLCKKAKLLRQEQRERKSAQPGSSESISLKCKTAPATKSLEDLLHEPLPSSPAHRLEIRLVRSSPASQEFKSTFKTALGVYQRYQTTIHNEPPEKVTEKQFTRFLVASPLKPWKPRNGPPQGYGSFHQQYWLDDRLIAVGVIDILPNCVSSVYFFYDPEFHFLVLGTYGSLREIAFCRSLQHNSPSLRSYYMGFYIHSCAKMRYKGAYSPSYLLCPETYTWHPIERCLPRLEKSKYCRFHEDPELKDPDSVADINHVSVLFHNKVMRYRTYCTLRQSTSHSEEVAQYADLVGNQLAKRMMLILN